MLVPFPGYIKALVGVAVQPDLEKIGEGQVDRHPTQGGIVQPKSGRFFMGAFLTKSYGFLTLVSRGN